MSEAATDTEVAEITERLAKATPGPWTCDDGNVFRTDHPFEKIDCHGRANNYEDASFIATARNLLPALLSRIAAQDAARVADGVRIAELEADCAQFDARALADNANLRADLAAALEALRPFAEAEIDIDYLDEELWVSFERITYGDLRRARALAAKPDGGTNE